MFIDTEGFESTGHSNTYDDRIFALSTLMSSLLIYNLPEAIRESDIAKLSFAVELADGFYRRKMPATSSHGGDLARSNSDISGGESEEVDEAAVSMEPGNMLWVIQRDFLQVSACCMSLATALTLAA